MAVKKIPAISVQEMYTIALFQFPVFIKVKLSWENAEKVVKPPQKPVTSKSCIDEFWLLVFSLIPHKIPIIKDPSRLIISVPMGSEMLCGGLNSLPIRYRITEPVPPPIKTRRRALFMVA